MFFSASSAAFFLSSLKREFPPSMSRSPGSSSSRSSSTVSRVASPAGTITHTMRGASSADTSSASEAVSVTSGLRS